MPQMYIFTTRVRPYLLAIVFSECLIYTKNISTLLVVTVTTTGLMEYDLRMINFVKKIRKSALANPSVLLNYPRYIILKNFC